MATVAVTPARSLAQRQAALEIANDTRSRRAALKRDVKAGRVSMRALLENPPEWLLTANVFKFMLVVPKIGEVKASKTFSACGISRRKTFGGLSFHQRRNLMDLVADRVPAGPRPPCAQAAEHLERANVVGRGRAALKRRVVRGDVTVADVLADPPECVESLQIGRLIEWQHGWGPYRVGRLLHRLMISEHRRVRELTDRQLNALLRAIG